MDLVIKINNYQKSLFRNHVKNIFGLGKQEAEVKMLDSSHKLSLKVIWKQLLAKQP